MDRKDPRRQTSPAGDAAHARLAGLRRNETLAPRAMQRPAPTARVTEQDTREATGFALNRQHRLEAAEQREHNYRTRGVRSSAPPEAIKRALAQFHPRRPANSGFGPDVGTTAHDESMHRLLETGFKTRVVLHPGTRNGHCLFECFGEFGSVQSLRRGVVLHYEQHTELHPELAQFGDTESIARHVANMLCVNKDGVLKQTAGFDSQGGEAEIITLARICKANIVTVAFTGKEETLTFRVYLSKEIGGVQKVCTISTDSPVRVKECTRNGTLDNVVIGLVDGHWIRFEVDTLRQKTK